MEENVESFKNLQDNLARQGTSLDNVPYVLQYNKRDMPNPAPVHYLEFLLNNRSVRVPSFVGVATSGQGVFSTLNAITRLLLQKFARENEEASAKHQRAVHPHAASTALSGIAAGTSATRR
jgi:signal recognition particle receptor subunit beta